MVSQSVLSEIRRTNRNSILTAILISGLTLWFGWLSVDYFRAGFLGATEVRESDLNRMAIDNRDFIAVKAVEIHDTGVAHIEKKKRRFGNTSEKVTGGYLVLKLDTRFLLVRTDGDTTEKLNYEGELREIPADVDKSFLATIKAQAPETAERFYPFILNENSYSFGPYIWLGVLLLVAVTCTRSIRLDLLTLRNPTTSEICVDLQKYGNLLEVCAEIESELKLRPTSIGKLLSTKSWIISKNIFGVKYVKCAKVVWVFAKVTQHSTNFIPTHKSYEMVVRTEMGDSVIFQMSKSNSEIFLTQMQAKSPWAIFGFDDKLESMWTSNRSEFLAAVEGRRKNLAS